MNQSLAPVDFGTKEAKTPLELRSHIDLLEKHMLEATDIQIDFEKLTKHYFAKGLYAREITIPAGTLLTGKIHLTQHINVISKGDISVLTEEGIKRIKAPATIISPPGTKRVGYTHEETVWTTFHATEETDLVKLEEQLIAPSHEAFELSQKERDLLCHG